MFDEFFGNTPEVMAEAYGDYEEHCLFLLVVDQELGRAAGTVRVILPSAVGLKSLNDVAHEPLRLTAAGIAQHHRIDDVRRCWDIGTLAVVKDYRGAATDHLISLMLYGHLYRVLRSRDIDHLVTILDKHAYVQLTELLRVPFVPIAGSEPFSYLGSDNSRAAYLHVPQVKPSVESYMRALPPEMLRLLRPHLARLLYCEGMSPLVEVQAPERTSCVRIATLTR